MEKEIQFQRPPVNDPVTDNTGTEERAGSAPEGGAPALPCQESANGNRKVTETDGKTILNHWRDALKSGHVLKLNVEEMVRLNGDARVGFLTLTLPVNLTWENPAHWREAQRRFKSLRTGCLSKLFTAYAAVLEPQASGRIHWHLVVSTVEDIRGGLNFDEVKGGCYKSANGSLRRIWKTLREKLPLYGFGRHELLPVKKTGAAIAAYVGGYLSKEIGLHVAGKKLPGKRVRYSQGWRVANKTYAWNTAGGRMWRRSLQTCAGLLGYRSLNDFSKAFGPRWAYHLAPLVVWTAQHLPPVDETESPTMKMIPEGLARMLKTAFGSGVVVTGERGPLQAPVFLPSATG